MFLFGDVVLKYHFLLASNASAAKTAYFEG